MLMYNIKTIRGTIFCPPIKYTREFVSTLADLCEDYLPVIVRDNGALPVFPIWQLSSPDEKEILFFNGEKIDLVQVIEGEVDHNTLQSFCERCKIVFSSILDYTKYPCTRIALAPSVIISEKGVMAPALFSRLFAIREYQGKKLDTSNLSQVYRINKEIGGNEIMINHVANFHAENELINVGGINQLRERYMGDFDINTMVNPDYKFTIEDINAFFGFVPSIFSSFYSLYFPE